MRRSLVSGDGGIQRVTDIGTDLRQFLRIVAAGFAFDHDLVRHDIGSHSAADDSDIGSSLKIYPAEGHGGDGFRGDTDGVDPLFGLDSGVSFLAMNGDRDGVLRGRAQNEIADCLGVESVAAGSF